MSLLALVSDQVIFLPALDMEDELKPGFYTGKLYELKGLPILFKIVQLS